MQIFLNICTIYNYDLFKDITYTTCKIYNFMHIPRMYMFVLLYIISLYMCVNLTLRIYISLEFYPSKSSNLRILKYHNLLQLTTV